MRRCTTISCFAAVLVTVLYAIADDQPAGATATSVDKKRSEKKLRFAIRPSKVKDRLLAVAAAEDGDVPKDGMIVTCATMRFEKNAIVFTDVLIESQGQRIATKEATVRLDKVSGSNVSWDFSDDVKLTFTNKDAVKRFAAENDIPIR